MRRWKTTSAGSDHRLQPVDTGNPRDTGEGKAQEASLVVVLLEAVPLRSPPLNADDLATVASVAVSPQSFVRCDIYCGMVKHIVIIVAGWQS
ncbi:hypothetical protein OPV22_017152 [Ensete ventricosum]|uniref:Uncharacterized protein n=1 Tax=Ensete ventricosum TaxID=4639 RepID=A0AAV8QRH9_ENSVE|nr:hypothetical protein OPV22_017152 [Ensete ventricosum]